MESTQRAGFRVGGPLATTFAAPAAAALHATRQVCSRAQFAALRGETFLLRCNAGGTGPDLHATLSRVESGTATREAVDGCFVLHFEIEGDAAAEQSIYTVRHPALETFAVLAVPSSADGRSLAVVFNNPG
jgi:hypothetical protein